MSLSKYTKELEILKDLFGSNFVENRLENIKKVYNASGFYWDRNLKYIIRKGIKIKYLLIGEAPPYYDISEKERVKYFYNPNNTTVPQSYLEKVFNSLYPDQKVDNIKYTVNEKQQKLDLIADKGFLLVDSLPFAMDYSANNKRDRTAYKNLVKECAKSYLSDKLKNSNIPWNHQCVKIAFSVWRNAREIIANRPQYFKFEHSIKSETNTKPPFKQVAVNGSWNLCENSLRRIFYGECLA